MKNPQGLSRSYLIPSLQSSPSNSPLSDFLLVFLSILRTDVPVLNSPFPKWLPFCDLLYSYHWRSIALPTKHLSLSLPPLSFSLMSLFFLETAIPPSPEWRFYYCTYYSFFFRFSHDPSRLYRPPPPLPAPPPPRSVSHLFLPELGFFTS